MKSPPLKATQYGFIWGAATVERVTDHNGHVVIAIKTPRETMILRVTPSGLIRVSDGKDPGKVEAKEPPVFHKHHDDDPMFGFD